MKITAPHLLGIALISALVSAASITSHSLWVDELGTWTISQVPNWATWAKKLWNHFNSDGQLPAYHAYIKLWVDLLGDQATHLRASNVPWLFLALWGLLRLPAKSQRRIWLSIFFFCINSFTWYYINELRPYIILQTGSVWFLVGAWRLATSSPDDRNTVDTATKEVLLGIVIMIAGNILGAFWIASTLFAFLILLPSTLLAAIKSLIRNWVFTLAIAIALAAMLTVALHSFAAGARASQLAAFSIAGFGYGLIELTGASGLGPSRHQLRSDLASVSWSQLLTMVLLAALVALTVLESWLAIPSRRLKTLLLVAAASPLLIMIALGVLLHWRVVGRHLSVIFPFVAIALAFFAEKSLFSSTSILRRASIILIILGLSCSSLTTRMAERHRKDDYKQAAIWVKHALESGESVLWVAAPEGLAYYKIAKSQNDIASIPLLYTYGDFQQRMPSGDWPIHIVKSYREGIDPSGLTNSFLASGKYESVGKATTFEHFRIRRLCCTNRVSDGMTPTPGGPMPQQPPARFWDGRSG